jgi:hypothetical protein
MGAVPGYKPDLLGGLEIVKWHTGHFAIRTPPPPGQDPQDDHPVTWNFVLPRKREAVAMRRLLLDAVGGDWAVLPGGDDGEVDADRVPRDVWLRLARLDAAAEDAFRRRAYRVCLLCGYAPYACACHRPVEPRDPRRWTADDMAWSR